MTIISPALFPAVTVTGVRDRKIRTTLGTNQIAGFVTVPSWKEINPCFSRDVTKIQIKKLLNLLRFYFHDA